MEAKLAEERLPFYYDCSRLAFWPFMAAPLGDAQGTMVLGPQEVARDHHDFLSSLGHLPEVGSARVIFRSMIWRKRRCLAMQIPTQLRDEANRLGLYLWLGCITPEQACAEELRQFLLGYVQISNIIFGVNLPDSGAEYVIESLRNPAQRAEVADRMRLLEKMSLTISSVLTERTNHFSRKLIMLLRSGARRTRVASPSLVLLSQDCRLESALELLITESRDGFLETTSSGNYQLTADNSIYQMISARYLNHEAEPSSVELRNLSAGWCVILR